MTSHKEGEGGWFFVTQVHKAQGIEVQPGGGCLEKFQTCVMSFLNSTYGFLESRYKKLVIESPC